jgi:bifunctional DNA-binding transcriptional regulator/antitoxin component of YhaV-PrlF toxin-antitoxin module
MYERCRPLETEFNLEAIDNPCLPKPDYGVKITRTGQVTIPPAMRRKHGLLAQSEVELVDQPDGVLVVKAAANRRGKSVLASLLRGGKIKGRTEDWLRLTRG